jgi:chromosome partitioning protein
MIKWAAVAQKGGTGKTTGAIHLAYEGARRGLRVLLLDIDQQASAVKWADRRIAAAIDIDVASEHAGRLPAALAGAEKEGYDLVVIDTAPNADTAGLAAARAADLVIIPCRPSSLDLDAIATTVDLCKLARRRAVVVINAAPIRSKVVDQARAVVIGWGGEVCPVVIHERVAFRHALVDGRVVQEFEPDGAAAREIGALFSELLPGHVAMNAIGREDVKTLRHAGGFA